MNKLFTGIILLAIAMVISSVSAYFSVVGLAALFAATAIPVIIMGSSIEAGKFIATSWLHANWKNPNVSRKMKYGMGFMIFVAMLVTAIGVYGFLSKGHLEQEAPVEGLELQIAQKQQQITMLQEDNNGLLAKQKQLDASIDTYLKKDNANAGLRARKAQSSERQSIDKQITANNDQIKKLNEEILPLKMQSSEVHAKLGPVKYVAELLGLTDTGSAVRMIILLIMVVFDPFALMLLISSTITLGEHFQEKADKKKTDIQLPVSQPVTPEPETNISGHLDDHPDFGEEPDPQTAKLMPVVEPQIIEEKPKVKRRGRKKKENPNDDQKYQEELRKFVDEAYLGKQEVTVDDVLDRIAAAPQDEKDAIIAMLEKSPDVLDKIIQTIEDVKNEETKPSANDGEVSHTSAQSNDSSSSGWLKH